MFDLFSEIAISRRTAVWRRNRVGISYKCCKAVELPQRPAIGFAAELSSIERLTIGLKRRQEE